MLEAPRRCRRCQAPLAPEDTSWGREGKGAAWSCTQCGAVRVEANAEKPRSTDVLAERGEGLGGYRATARGGEVVLVRRWRRPIHFLLLFGPIGVVAGIVTLMLLGYGDAAAVFAQFWYQAILGIVVAFYLGLCGLVNTTRLELHDGMLKVAHGPLPLRKDLTWPTGDFTDVWTQHVRVANAPDIYRLRVALKSGGELALLDQLPSLEDSVFVEEKIARHIGIADR